jgi:hypothetical protein
MKTVCLLIGISLVCRLFHHQEAAFGQSPVSGGGTELFDAEAPLQMTLCFDFKTFLKTRANPEYVGAVLKVNAADGDTLVQEVRIKARGEMRRNYCYLPPIMLKFRKSSPDSSIYPSGGTLKLVTHCNTSAEFKNYVLKEYLVYRLYNHLTPYSLRTRLVQICYRDIAGHRKDMVSYGFLIEDAEQMAGRNHAVVVRADKLSQSQMDPADMARVAIFNYMIGNTDWSVALQHNVKVLKVLDFTAQKGIPVAYDFDYSGFVNTTYSAPFEQLPIKTVLERYYLGVCVSDSVLNSVVSEILAEKEAFLNTIQALEELPQSQRKQAASYLNGFYKMYRQEDGYISEFRCKCQRF